MTVKLVRDRIPEIIQKSGKKPFMHVADDGEYINRLTDKLREECEEFVQSRKPEELADLLEVIYALGEVVGVSREEIEIIRQKKENERGTFKNKIILEKVNP
jgi:predicted house-cleaning noncanonical NTP pyrophosphatase (MazG superfamily)